MHPHRPFLILACLLLAGAVLTGAFGAHALREVLSPDRLRVWQTAVDYQHWHGLGLLALAWMGQRAAASLLLAGIAIFCGSLYLLAAGLPSWIGMITPIGGLLLVISWILAAWRLIRGER